MSGMLLTPKKSQSSAANGLSTNRMQVAITPCFRYFCIRLMIEKKPRRIFRLKGFLHSINPKGEFKQEFGVVNCTQFDKESKLCEVCGCKAICSEEKTILIRISLR